MEQYVSKAALVTEIEKRIADNKKEIERASHKNLEDYFEGYEDALTLFKEQFLNTLEVKEAKEVNLENEFFNWYNEEKNRDYNASILYEKYSTISKKFAKHFFELGLNAQRKIGYVPNIDDSLKELGVDPSSKEAKIFKESYCAALDKFMAQKGE